MYGKKTPEDKIKELEKQIFDLHSEISNLKQQIGFGKQPYTNNLVERIKKLEMITGEPFSLFKYPMEGQLRALKELVGPDGKQHAGEETRYNITIFRILFELRGMRNHLDALQSRAEKEARPDGLDENNMVEKDTKMYQLKHILVDALGVVSLSDILEVNALCWRCYNTPVMEPASLTPGDVKLKDRGTRKLVEDIDKMIETLGKQIDFKNYVKYFDEKS